MGKGIPENNKKPKEWIKPNIKELALSDTLGGATTSKYERAKTNVYGGS